MDDLNTLNKKLFPYAYNILGNIDDCQDVIQDVLIKFNEKGVSSISNQNAYLIKSVINQAINLKKKKDRQRQQKITLPEPIVTNQGESKIELDEILNYSMFVLLDTLNTKERAVFLLKEAFDYEHDEIAEILEISIKRTFSISDQHLNQMQGNVMNWLAVLLHKTNWWTKATHFCHLREVQKTVKPNNEVADGVYFENKEFISGYVVVKADTIDEAVEIAKANPIFDQVSGNIEVREVLKRD
ncbi:hypothetical protein FQR65_LT15508 [Abscondita terminalis]|nr:hypothetical protein FQR65_LT15508 [Abscondita terminalis]